MIKLFASRWTPAQQPSGDMINLGMLEDGNHRLYVFTLNKKPTAAIYAMNILSGEWWVLDGMGAQDEAIDLPPTIKTVN